MTPDEEWSQPSYGAAKETWWWKYEMGGNIILKMFTHRTIAFPQGTLGSVTKHLRSLAKLLRFPEKHCDLLQHICVCSQNYWVTPRNFMISFAKHLCLLTHLLHFPEKRWVLSQKNWNIVFFPTSYYVSHKGFARERKVSQETVKVLQDKAKFLKVT